MEERLVMDYTTLGPESKAGQEQPPKGMQSLYEVCCKVVDGRGARGKRYELAGLLVVLVLAKLAGMQSLLGASEWIVDQEALLRQGLHLSWKRMPCTNTYSYALERLDRKPREYSPGSLV
jgi:DDE family transposase